MSAPASTAAASRTTQAMHAIGAMLDAHPDKLVMIGLTRAERAHLEQRGTISHQIAPTTMPRYQRKLGEPITPASIRVVERQRRRQARKIAAKNEADALHEEIAEDFRRKEKGLSP